MCCLWLEQTTGFQAIVSIKLISVPLIWRQNKLRLKHMHNFNIMCMFSAINLLFLETKFLVLKAVKINFNICKAIPCKM